MALPAIPGFPWESIIAGIMLGLTALAIVRRRRK
jgi:LPXTG-motif cell wall-anchored protein